MADPDGASADDRLTRTLEALGERLVVPDAPPVEPGTWGGPDAARARTLFSFGLAPSLMVVVLLIEWTLEPGLVEGTARLAQSPHGVLFALCTVVSGAAVLGLLSPLTARSIERRDLSEELSSREVGL